MASSHRVSCRELCNSPGDTVKWSNHYTRSWVEVACELFAMCMRPFGIWGKQWTLPWSSKSRCRWYAFSGQITPNLSETICLRLLEHRVARFQTQFCMPWVFSCWQGMFAAPRPPVWLLRKATGESSRFHGFLLLTEAASPTRRRSTSLPPVSTRGELISKLENDRDKMLMWMGHWQEKTGRWA